MTTRLDANSLSRSSSLPPIVLVAEEDHERLDATSRHFDRRGLWTATADEPEDALLTVEELKPDVVVTDLLPSYADGGGVLFRDLQRSLREDAPIIVLSDAPAATFSDARAQDIVLPASMPLELLLQRVHAALERSRMLCARGSAALRRGEQLRERSIRLQEQLRGVTAEAPSDRQDAANRACPKCGTHLEWIERGTLGGADYDYYHWCFHGCGLFCYDRALHRWLKLAG